MPWIVRLSAGNAGHWACFGFPAEANLPKPLQDIRHCACVPITASRGTNAPAVQGICKSLVARHAAGLDLLDDRQRIRRENISRALIHLPTESASFGEVRR